MLFVPLRLPSNRHQQHQQRVRTFKSFFYYQPTKVNTLFVIQRLHRRYKLRAVAVFVVSKLSPEDNGTFIY